MFIDSDVFFGRLELTPEAQYTGQMIRKYAAMCTVDAEKVVRCKDCALRHNPCACPMCFLIDGVWVDYTQDMGYCDRGTRGVE